MESPVVMRQPEEDRQPKQSLISSKVFWVVCIVFVLIVATVATLIFADRLELVTKQPYEAVFVQSELCGSSEISEFNDATPDIGGDRYDEVYSNVSYMEQYRSDIDCVYIALHHSLASEDEEAASDYFADYESLIEEGNRLSGKFDVPVGLRGLEIRLDALSTGLDDISESVIGEDG